MGDFNLPSATAKGTVDEGKGLMRSVGAGMLDRSNGEGGGRLEGKIDENVQRRCTQSGDRGQGRRQGEWWRQWSQETGCDREGGGDPHRLARQRRADRRGRGVKEEHGHVWCSQGSTQPHPIPPNAMVSRPAVGHTFHR